MVPVSTKWVKIVIASFIITHLSIVGCTTPPKGGSPLSSVPKMIMDYDFTAAKTEIWVLGMVEDKKYTNITITITHVAYGSSTVAENNTYCVSHNTALHEFMLDIIVVDETIIYRYTVDVAVSPELDPIFRVTETIEDGTIKEIEIYSHELPYKKMLKEAV
jgi:hypothetical protein